MQSPSLACDHVIISAFLTQSDDCDDEPDFLVFFSPQDLKLSAETYRIYSLFHSLHHYKYHTFLQCKKEVSKNTSRERTRLIRLSQKSGAASRSPR